VGQGHGGVPMMNEAGFPECSRSTMPCNCSRIAESSQEAMGARPDWVGDWEGNCCKAVET
jgi:hypothetical protein